MPLLMAVQQAYQWYNNLAKASEAVLAMVRLLFWSLQAMLTSGFDFQHGVSYQCAIVTTAVKCTISKLRASDKETDGQLHAKLLSAS